MSEDEERAHYKTVKQKYSNIEEILAYIRELDENKVEGPKRKELILKKFLDMDEKDVLFLLFYPYSWD